MPEQHPQQPFLFNEMSLPPKLEKPETEEIEKGEKKEPVEKEGQFKIMKNTGFTLTLKCESPIYFEKTY